MKYPDYETAPIEPNWTRISEVILWTMKHRDSYPLPDEFVIYTDMPETVLVDMKDFCNMSKKAFAKRKEVAQSQLSRWIAAGLPVREDGRINVWEGDWWLERYAKQCAKRKANGWQD